MTPSLVVDGVGLVAQGRLVLDGVRLRAGGGEVLAIVGPNGAGKSTLLGVIAGDLRPTAGGVRLLGREPTAWGARGLARVRAVLPQQTAIEFPFTAREVVEMGRTPHGREDREGVSVVARCLAATDTRHLADRPVSRMSVGERSRVAFARVLAQEAPVLLLDEPTAALDIRHQHLVMRIAREEARAGRLVVVVLHDLNLAARYADRALLMVGGRAAGWGPVDEVLTGPALTEAFGHPVRVLRDPDAGVPLIVGEAVVPTGRDAARV